MTPDYRFVVSDRLRGDYSNGKSYYPLSEQPIHLPDDEAERPNPELLEWHLANVFRGA